MAAQSFAMGHAFGTSFQYGKRKISSMTNEEFNALSATDLHGELQADIRAMIPDMHESFKRMEQFQIDILISMVNVIRKAGEQFLGLLTGQGGSSTQSSTSAIDFSDTGIFNIQGGSRQDNALTNANPRSSTFLNAEGQTYEEWLASNQVGATVATLKRRTTVGAQRLSSDIQRSKIAASQVNPIQKIVNAPAFSSAQQIAANKAVQKKKILQNITSLQGMVKLKALELKRFTATGVPSTSGTRQQQIFAAAKANAAKQKGARILLNQLKDLQKKLSNAQVILKNYR